MTLQPIWAASTAVQIHLAFALLTFALGIVMFTRRKGTASHRALGRIWMALILIAAVSSFWITGLAGNGHFSVIHILSVVTILAAGGAVLAIRRGHVRTHRNAVIALFIGAMIGAGAGAFVPGRLLSQVFGYA